MQGELYIRPRPINTRGNSARLLLFGYLLLFSAALFTWWLWRTRHKPPVASAAMPERERAFIEWLEEKSRERDSSA